MEQKQTNGMAVASLVLGIVSAVCIFFGYFAFIGIITGIIGLILGIMAKKKQPCGMATAGIVLSAVALGLCVITFIACFACTACAGQRRFLELSCLISTAVSSIVEEHMEKRGRFLLRFFFVPIPS